MAAALDNVVLDALRGVRRDVQNQEWYRSLRVIGYLPLWMVVAGAMALGDYDRLRRGGGRLSWAAFTRSGIVFWLPLLAGLGAAAMKILARRLRPMDAGGAWYVFRPINERTIHGGGLSLPSEHAASRVGTLSF